LIQRWCDGRPVWSRTSDCQSGNPGSNPGRRIHLKYNTNMTKLILEESKVQKQVIIIIQNANQLMLEKTNIDEPNSKKPHSPIAILCLPLSK
jgi:hypothetical protein